MFKSLLNTGVSSSVGICDVCSVSVKDVEYALELAQLSCSGFCWSTYVLIRRYLFIVA